jgi:hypothetical protein
LPGADFPFYFDEVQAISYLADEGELYATFSTPEYVSIKLFSAHLILTFYLNVYLFIFFF